MQGVEHDRDVPRKQARDCTGRSLVRNMQHLDARRRLEELRGEVLRRSDTGRTVRQLARVGLGIGDEFLERVRGDRGIERDRHRSRRHLLDRSQVPDRIVGHVAIQAHRHHQRVRGDQQGVAIRRRLDDHVGADVATRARAVVDDDRLPPAFRQLLPDCAREDVHAGPRSEGDDDLHRPVRIRLLCALRRGLRRCAAREQSGAGKRDDPLHRSPLHRSRRTSHRFLLCAARTLVNRDMSLGHDAQEFMTRMYAAAAGVICYHRAFRDGTRRSVCSRRKVRPAPSG